MIKRTFILAIAVITVLAMAAVPCSAAVSSDKFQTDTVVAVTGDLDGLHFVTTIETDSTTNAQSDSAVLKAASTTKTGSKSAKYYNGSSLLWYVKVTGTFSYNGSSATCTKASVTAASNNSYWKIGNKYSTKTGATATGTATAYRYFNGVVQQTIKRTVTLTCSKTGTLS